MNFLVRRKTNKEYEHMLVVWYWCEEMFGKDTRRWDAYFADGTEDIVKFDFRIPADATMFALKWGTNVNN